MTSDASGRFPIWGVPTIGVHRTHVWDKYWLEELRRHFPHRLNGIQMGILWSEYFVTPSLKEYEEERIKKHSLVGRFLAGTAPLPCFALHTPPVKGCDAAPDLDAEVLHPAARGAQVNS